LALSAVWRALRRGTRRLWVCDRRISELRRHARTLHRRRIRLARASRRSALDGALDAARAQRRTARLCAARPLCLRRFGLAVLTAAAQSHDLFGVVAVLGERTMGLRSNASPRYSGGGASRRRSKRRVAHHVPARDAVAHR